jgi:hypothetical protein
MQEASPVPHFIIGGMMHPPSRSKSRRWTTVFWQPPMFLQVIATRPDSAFKS